MHSYHFQIVRWHHSQQVHIDGDQVRIGSVFLELERRPHDSTVKCRGGEPQDQSIPCRREKNSKEGDSSREDQKVFTEEEDADENV